MADNNAYINAQKALAPIQSSKSQVSELNLNNYAAITFKLPSYEFWKADKQDKQIEDTVSEVQTNTIIEQQKYSNEDLYLLSQIIYSEAGSDWISDEIQLMVGSVVLNRVNSPYFPDNIYDVTHQKGQYQFILQNIEVIPNQRAIDNAKQLLDNQDNLTCPSNVIFQSESIQGDGIYKTYETKYTTLYFCYKD